MRFATHSLDLPPLPATAQIPASSTTSWILCSQERHYNLRTSTNIPLLIDDVRLWRDRRSSCRNNRHHGRHRQATSHRDGKTLLLPYINIQANQAPSFEPARNSPPAAAPNQSPSTTSSSKSAMIRPKSPASEPFSHGKMSAKTSKTPTIRVPTRTSLLVTTLWAV